MTIYDVAKKAHVSISSVSRYYNHPELLSEATREKISNVLGKSDFIPNQMARGLVLDSMKSVGIMMNDVQNYRFSTIAYNLERSFFEWGYSTLLCNSGDDWRKIEQYLYMLSSRRVDALILIGSMFGNYDISPAISRYFSTEIPIFSSDLDLDMPNSYSVTADHNYGMHSAVKHLAEKGHQELAFVTCTNSLNTTRKIDAFHRALNDYELPFNRDANLLRIPLSSAADPSLDVASIIKASGIAYTGLIFSTDQMAARAVSSLHFSGYHVPEDYAVIGYDNSQYALCCQPPLTSIDTQSGTIARVIANLVNDVFNQRAVGNHIIIKPTLVLRGST